MTHVPPTSYSVDSCVPLDNNHSCHVINGYTVILLDTGVTTAKELAYDAIKAALADEEFISEFAPAVAAASFLESGRDSFVVSSPSSPATDELQGPPMATTIAIAAASVAFVVMSLFAYGILRRRPLNLPKGLSSPIGSGHIGIKPGTYYEGLEDEQPSLFHLDINNDSPSNTWSVSDITSEGSIRSTLSRGTSTLEKIDEETLDEIEMYEAEEETDADTDRTAPRRSPESISHSISNFDAVDRRNTSQDNGPHDAMESMDLSREDYSDEELECTMVPVHMTPEEAQSMLDEFLLPFSQSPDEEDSFNTAEGGPTNVLPITEEALEVEEPKQDKIPDFRDAAEVAESEFQDAPVADKGCVEVEETTRSEGDEDLEGKCVDTDKEGVSEDPVIAEEETSEGASMVNLTVKDEVEGKCVLGDDVEEEEDSSEGPHCSPAGNEDMPTSDNETVTAEDAKLESSKVEEVVAPMMPAEDISTSCDVSESSKQSATNATKNDSGKESDDSTSTDSKGNEDAAAVSPDDSVSNAKEPINTETNTTSDASESNDPSQAVATQGCDTENGVETVTKETIDGDQEALERVASVEEPIGLSVHDISFDDSLALSTYTTESDEQVSLNGWIATFLTQLTSNEMCASECQTYPCQSEEKHAEE